MTAAEKYQAFKNEPDNEGIDTLPTEEECIAARQQDAKLPDQDFSFFYDEKPMRSKQF